ncbi:DMT family transporter [Aquimarina mytili]|uniref:DMT family transporter n=1 Tax=Aquimarina mytili TaxID=874423 RepID=A0A936ZZ88_9FLAO|nr:DMT family transporter [Aquimarina mytili]MBL0683881.1 DMT family transporter [Aquimarina mytili]
MNKKNIMSIYMQLFFAMAIAGSTIVISKLIVGKFPTFFGTTLTLIVAFIGITPAYIIKNKYQKVVPTKSEWKYLFAQAITGVVLFRMLSFYGLKMTSSIDAGIITSTTPAFIALIALFFLKERISKNMWIGIIFAMLGISMINVFSDMHNNDQLESQRVYGNLLIIFAVISEALFTIFRKKTQQIPAIHGSFHIIWIGLLFSVPFAFIDVDFTAVANYTMHDFLPIFYYGIFGSVISFFLWFNGVSKVSASIAGLFTGIMPVSAVILSFLLLDETIVWYHIVGIVLVLIGIFYGSKKKKI